MTSGPLIVALLTATAILIGFVGFWRFGNTVDPIEARLERLGQTGEPAVGARGKGTANGRRWRSLNQVLVGFGLGERVATMLFRADVPLTAAEYTFITVAVAAAGGAIGWLRGSALLAAVLGAVGLLLPLFYLSVRTRQRRQQFTNQLPDVLTLLTGAVRVGYGLTQAIDMLIDRLPKPASVEFARAIRAENLGQPILRALSDMAERVDSDDLYLVVTAISVQQELGGNLAQILETIAETIRERIHIKREIQVLTAQQRMTGYVLAFLPVAVALILSAINPTFLRPLYTDPQMRIVLIVAALMQLVGFFVIRKITDIEV